MVVTTSGENAVFLEASAERTANESCLLSGDFRAIPLTRGLVALVDAADYEALSQFKWRATSPTGRNTCYAARAENGRTILMHRQIMATPAGMVTDHISGDGLDNRRSNLRICTNAENLRNRRKAKSNRSGFKGVTAYGDAWRASVADHYVGCFETAEQAALAYDAAARERYGKFANLNFPDRNDPPPPRNKKGVSIDKRIEVLATYYAGTPLNEAIKIAGVKSRFAAWQWAQDPGVVRQARIIALQRLLAEAA